MRLNSVAPDLTVRIAVEIVTELLRFIFRACRRITDIEIKRVIRLPIIWVKAVLKEVRSK